MTSRHEWPKTEPCDYCGAAKPVVGYTGPETCPGCGLVWEYDEGARPTTESVRALVAAERKRCEAVVRYFLVYDNQRAVSWHEVQDCLERIREGGVSP